MTTGPAQLERGYRRWLRCYPASFRREHGEEILAVLLAGAQPGQRHPEPIECLDLLRSALRLRLRPSLPRSDRRAWNALRLLYLGAVLEFAAALTIRATFHDVKTAILHRHPSYTTAQWHNEVAGTLNPLLIAAGIAVALWLVIAWAHGRGHRWARFVLAAFVALNIYGMLHGLAQGSATYARADLAIGLVLCTVELAAVTLLFLHELRKLAHSRTST